MSDTTFGVKVTEELKEQIEKLMKESGLRTGKDFMQCLINNYQLERAKNHAPEVAEDLKELQTITQRINNIYLNLSYRVENINKAKDEEVRDLINKKDATIYSLEDQNLQLEEKATKVMIEYNEIVNQNDENVKRVNELYDSNSNSKALIEEYKSKNQVLLNNMKIYEKYPEQLATANQLIRGSEKEITNLSKIINEQTKNINNLKVESENILNENDKRHKEELQTIKDKLLFQKDKEILELEKSFNIKMQENQEAIRKVQEEYNCKVKLLLGENEEHNNKVRNLLEQLEKAKRN